MFSSSGFLSTHVWTFHGRRLCRRHWWWKLSAPLSRELAQYGKVILIERESEPGYHSTGRSATMFIVNYGTPEISRLTRLSDGFLKSPPRDFARHALFAPRRCVLLGERRNRGSRFGGQASDALRRKARATHHRRRLEHRSEHSPRSDRRRSGLLDTTTAGIDVHELLSSFLRLFRRGGEC
jgi:D-arginine dehydrogenase